MPTIDEAMNHLRGLEGPVHAHAEDYVRRVPAEIRAPFRAAFEHELGWRTPSGD